MSAPLEITSRVLVAAEPARVWQVAMDWSRQREWIWATQVRGGAGPGAEVVARTGLGPVGFTDTMVITEWDPPRRCVVRHTGRVVRGLGIFEVTGRGPDRNSGGPSGCSCPGRCPGGWGACWSCR